MGATSPHFQDSELACHHCGVNNCTQELVEALESLRQLIDKPIRVDDAYRCEEHNKEVGGEPNSVHLQGKAADISVTGLTATQLYDYACMIRTIQGIGRSDHEEYIHIDVRTNPAKWCYGKDGKQVAWYDPPREGVISV